MYHVVESNGITATNDRLFLLEEPDDYLSLPTSTPNDSGEITAIGSKAVTQDLEHGYLLGVDNTWREVLP